LGLQCERRRCQDDESLDEVRAAVQAGVVKAGKKWKANKWDGFVREVVWWLLNDKNKGR
jgi:hypothetical protein